MYLYVLHSKVTGPTARQLARLLNAKCGQHRQDVAKDVTHLIRWGNSGFSELDDRIPHVLNEAYITSAILNREHMYRSLSNAPSELQLVLPAFSSSHWGPNPSESIHRDYGSDRDIPRYVYRTRFGCQGHHIEPIRQSKPLRQEIPDGFMLQWFDADREVRVHICNGLSIGIQLKLKDGQPDIGGFQIRSYPNGWRYVPLSPELAHEHGISDRSLPRSLAKAVVSYLNLDFGACDIVRERSTGQWIFLEVNTGPGLEGQTLEAYAEHIRQWSRENDNTSIPRIDYSR